MQTSLPSQTNTNELWFRILIVAIIVVGIILRAAKYLPGWSMRGDELHVTLNLIDRSAIELATKPLDYEQAAPFGFLLLTKSLIVLFGTSEYVLRVVALVSGCLSLVLMYRLLSKTTGKYGMVFAMLAFACSYYLIYYSAELKQYASDALICIILALLFRGHISAMASSRDFWHLGIAGVLALCFSHPAIFVLAAIGLTLFLHYLKDRQRLMRISIVGAAWAGIFLVIYFSLLRHQTTSDYLITYWRNLNSFMPVPPWRDLSWFPATLGHLFTNIGGLAAGIQIILLLLFAFGLWVFWKEGKWQWSLIASLTIGINLIVSGFEKFPFHGRLIVYLLPLVYLVFAKALDGLLALIRNRAAMNVAYAALLLLLLRPAIPTASNFLLTKSYLQDDLKPVLSFVKDNVQDNDLIYTYHYMGRQFDYYAPLYELEDISIVRGQDYSRNVKKYQSELGSLPEGQRIWFVFTFVGEGRIDKGKKLDERDYILDYLNQNGSLIQEFYSTNDASSAHLFILR